MSFDGSGNLFVTEFGNGNVGKYSSNGTFLGNFATGLSAPAAVAFDAGGNVYISEYGGNSVREYASSGTFLENFASGGSLNGSASFGPYNQITGSDTILQSFTIDFMNSGPNQQFHLMLPSSASSSVNAVPEPNMAAAAGIITLCFSYCLRRKRK
jgi:hypothetical protein